MRKMKIEELTHEQFQLAIRVLAQQISSYDFTNLYGIPRGGSVVAVYLSHYTGIPLTQVLSPDKNVLIVDDICDTGDTIGSLAEDFCTAVIYYNKKCTAVVPDFWVFEAVNFIKFPWETEESAKVDYKEKV